MQIAIFEMIDFLMIYPFKIKSFYSFLQIGHTSENACNSLPINTLSLGSLIYWESKLNGK